jgi:hypothetical protein
MVVGLLFLRKDHLMTTYDPADASLKILSIGFTGTQDGMGEGQARTLKDFLALLRMKAQYRYFHHGDCVGADLEACLHAKRLTFEIISHPPSNESKRAFAGYDYQFAPDEYLERNRSIVDHSGLIITCPKSDKEELRSGTWATYRYARKQLKPITMIFPSGVMKFE